MPADEYCFTLSPKVKLYNVIMLGITFMFIFAGYNTVTNIVEILLYSYQEEHEDFTGDGYTSMAIIYIIVAGANWIAPSIITIMGSKYALFSAGCIYTLYVAMLIQPNVIALYTVSVLMGFASAVIWTAMGTFLTMNSDDKTMGRNAAIFITIAQFSLLIGSLYVYFDWRGVTTITDSNRIRMMIVFTAVTGFGAFLMLFFRSPPKSSTVEVTPSSSGINENTPLISEQRDEESAVVVSTRNKPSLLRQAWLEFVGAIKLFKTSDMLKLCALSAYSGLELSFTSIYATTAGNTLAFGNDTDLMVGLTSTVMGVGEIVGGIALGVLDEFAPIQGRAIGVLSVMVIHTVAYFLIFISTPDLAVVGPTTNIAYIPPNETMAIFISLFLGLGDASINILIFGFVGLRYSEDPAPAYALSNFVQSLGIAVTFFYGSNFVLKWQLLILIIFLIPGTLFYIDVELRYQYREKAQKKLEEAQKKLEEQQKKLEEEQKKLELNEQ